MTTDAKNPITFPDYDNSILSLSNSILRHYGVKTDYRGLDVSDQALAKNKKNVILMIFDGMGVDLLTKNAPEKSFLRDHVRRDISSVFPPTTAAATSTLYSGLPPCVHGWLAWACYFKEYGKVIELFRNRDFYTQKPSGLPPVEPKLKYTHLFEKIQAASPDVAVTEIFPAFKPDGVRSVNALCEKALATSRRDGRQLILTYWADPDHAAHEYGPYDRPIKQVIANIDKRVKELCDRLQNAVVIVTADHGQIPIKGVFYVDDDPEMLDCLSAPISMDDRVASVFLKTGKEKQFLQAFDRRLSENFMLLSKKQVFESNLFGVGPFHPYAKNFIGDYLIISTSNASLRQRTAGGAPYPDLKGAHSGLTAVEMRVPLIIIEKD